MGECFSFLQYKSIIDRNGICNLIQVNQNQIPVMPANEVSRQHGFPGGNRKREGATIGAVAGGVTTSGTVGLGLDRV
jgi:hypothetical protein